MSFSIRYRNINFQGFRAFYARVWVSVRPSFPTRHVIFSVAPSCAFNNARLWGNMINRQQKGMDSLLPFVHHIYSHAHHKHAYHGKYHIIPVPFANEGNFTHGRPPTFVSHGRVPKKSSGSAKQRQR